MKILLLARVLLGVLLTAEVGRVTEPEWKATFNSPPGAPYRTRLPLVAVFTSPMPRPYVPLVAFSPLTGP